MRAGVGDHPDPANGPANPDVHTRLFGKAESDIRVKFYRDSAAWCPYCQRVRRRYLGPEMQLRPAHTCCTAP